MHTHTEMHCANIAAILIGFTLVFTSSHLQKDHLFFMYDNLSVSAQLKATCFGEDT